MRYKIFLGLFFIVLSFGFVCSTTTTNKKQLSSSIKTISYDCEAPIKSGLLANKIKGMSFVAPPNPFPNDPLIALNKLGVDWVAVLPYAYFSKDQPTIQSFGTGGWWGESPEGICQTINYAHQKKIKVMLKPQLWTHNQWIGDLNLKTDESWAVFEKNYTNFILKWATIADSMKVDLFCIGTEIRHSVEQRPVFWRALIDKVRTIYKGKLTYAPNWDDYDKVTFWDQLDYIGTDAYFPLLADKTPSVCALKRAWQPTLMQLSAYAKKWNKPIVFTEFGYLSLDGCADKTWELEKRRASVGINQAAQAHAIQALLEIFSKEDWWAGGFLWKWYPNYKSAMGEGKRERDYTPQGKMAEKVLEKMYKN
ncbi:glycoside hydrolase family 113 [Aureispira anguillae]|uniref:Glycoside hydrolase n=1 Tax=Aureispira anguillae TaxID=2864201 RepID=A0A915YDE2_9BACT|nr:hypothetical protein [Aureispira anguillae]BDS11039.1 hypothetical protein AsAng_0017500 [Aureispira anguillae]